MAEHRTKNSWFRPEERAGTKEGEAFAPTEWQRSWQLAAGSWQQERLESMIRNFKDLVVYKKAFEHAMGVFEVSKKFPKEEQYSLTDQIRRSSRSVCTNIGEAWRKRRYPAHFVSKLTDADAEVTETMIWLDFAVGCAYIDSTVHANFSSEYEQIGKMLGAMISAPEKFCYESKKSK